MTTRPSTKAHDYTLSEWFGLIKSGQIKLPRFQRHQAWDQRRIQSLLDTVTKNLPLGVTLVLRVDGPEPFVSRYLATAEPLNASATTMHLLDGQQRLTAFWRAMHDNYEGDTYFIHVPSLDLRPADDDEEREVSVKAVKRRRDPDGKSLPRWVDDPAECYQRGLIPVHLLCPVSLEDAIGKWTEAALAPFRPDPGASVEARLAAYEAFEPRSHHLAKVLSNLRSTVTHYNLPYLALPADTAKEVALRVFINMNTNSKPLSMYDIVVAEVEDVSGESLHEMVEDVRANSPKVGRYGNLEDLVLSTSALLQEKSPILRGYVEMDKAVLVENWGHLHSALARMADFLEEERVFDAKRLPMFAVLPVIAALLHHTGTEGDRSARDRRLLRRYLWSSFFSDRYSKTTSTRSLADYKALRALVTDAPTLASDFTSEQLKRVPVLNRDLHPLASIEHLTSAGWPTKGESLARAILCASLYFGARDFADDSGASFDTIQGREYHHLFPDKLLTDAELASSLALNCALITTKTNRSIGRKDPITYLKERTGWTSEEDLANRLRSHLVVFDALNKGPYMSLEDVELRAAVAPDFRAFIRSRAEVVSHLANELAEGNKPALHHLMPESLDE